MRPSKPMRIEPEDYEVQADGCWIYTRAKPGGNGYAQVKRGRAGRFGLIGAHRLAYIQKHGPIPEGLVIDHLCRTPLCVNPDHLEAVTHAENILRGTAPSALNARQTHCKRGHALEGDNLKIIRASGSRVCRICQSARMHAKYYGVPYEEALAWAESRPIVIRGEYRKAA